MGTPYDETGNPQSATLTSYYFGGTYEVTGTDVKKYYSFGGQTVMRDADGLQYFLTDHLGSVVAITNASGTLTSQQRYLPFGGVRSDITTPNAPNSDFGYTGQRMLDSGMGGLMDYNARFYSPYLNRFIQPDSIVPDPVNPQAFNRFSYVMNRPINFNDPTGHCVPEDGYDGCGPWGGGRNNGGGGGGGNNDDTGGGGGGGSGDDLSITFMPPPGWTPTYIRTSSGGDPNAPLTSYLSSSNLSSAERFYSSVRDLYYLTMFSPAVKAGNFGLSGNSQPWGLVGRNYTSRTINNAYLKNAVSPSSLIGVSMATNFIDYKWGTHADEGVLSQGYASSVTVDSLSGIVTTGLPALGTYTFLGASPPGWAVVATIVTAGAASWAFDASGGRELTKRGLDSTIDWLQVVGSGQENYYCDGWACKK